MRKLNLSKNHITAIPDYFLQGMSSLVELYLNHNQLVCVGQTFHGDLPNVKILDLSNNR